MEIVNLARNEIRDTLKGMLDKGIYWCLLAHTNKGGYLFKRIDETHYCFDPKALPIFNIMKRDTKQVVGFAFVERDRVSAADIAKYLTEFDNPTTADEVESTGKYGIIVTTSHPLDGASLLKWFQNIVGDKYFYGDNEMQDVFERNF